MRLGESQHNQFLEEVKMLQRLRHKNIIECYDFWENKEKKQVNFITELMSSGTLKSFIKKKKVNLRMIRNWSRQILNALDYLHTGGSGSGVIIHRDLKCDNMFINGNLGEVKLGDLGLSCTLEETYAQSVIGTPEFMAPELYEEQYTEKVDIYAFGMCILEIFTGEYPYNECANAAQIYKKVTAGTPPASLVRMENVAVKKFIQDCLKSAETRPSARELLNHPLLVGLDVEDQKNGAGEAIAAPMPAPPVTVVQEVDKAPKLPELPRTTSPVLEEEEEEGEDASKETLSASPLDTSYGRLSTKLTDRDLSAETTVIDENTISARMAIGDDNATKMCVTAMIAQELKEIEFDYDLDHDDSETVAKELRDQTNIAVSEEDIEKAILKAINEFKHDKAVTQPVAQSLGAPISQSAQPSPGASFSSDSGLVAGVSGQSLNPPGSASDASGTSPVIASAPVEQQKMGEQMPNMQQMQQQQMQQLQQQQQQQLQQMQQQQAAAVAAQAQQHQQQQQQILSPSSTQTQQQQQSQTPAVRHSQDVRMQAPALHTTVRPGLARHSVDAPRGAQSIVGGGHLDHYGLVHSQSMNAATEPSMDQQLDELERAFVSFTP